MKGVDVGKIQGRAWRGLAIALASVSGRMDDAVCVLDHAAVWCMNRARECDRLIRDR